MSLFTAAVINAMQTAVDGTKCADIEGKEVSVSYWITIIHCSLSRAMNDKIKKRKSSYQIRFLRLGRSKDTMIIKINSEEPRNINK